MISSGRHLLTMVLISGLASCYKPAEFVSAPEGQVRRDVCDQLQIKFILVKGERDFLRRLPELAREVSSKSELIARLEERAILKHESGLKIEETPDGIRWGWLLITIQEKDMEIRAVRVHPEGLDGAFKEDGHLDGMQFTDPKILPLEPWVLP